MKNVWNTDQVIVKKLLQSSHSIPINEQEFTLSGTRDESYYDISCSDRTMITVLSKSALFVCYEFIVSQDAQESVFDSKKHSDKVLYVRGILPKQGLSILRKKRVSKSKVVKL